MTAKQDKSSNVNHTNVNITGNTTNNYYIYAFIVGIGLLLAAYFGGVFNSKSDAPQQGQQQEQVRTGGAKVN